MTLSVWLIPNISNMVTSWGPPPWFKLIYKRNIIEITSCIWVAAPFCLIESEIRASLGEIEPTPGMKDFLLIPGLGVGSGDPQWLHWSSGLDLCLIIRLSSVSKLTLLSWQQFSFVLDARNEDFYVQIEKYKKFSFTYIWIVCVNWRSFVNNPPWYERLVWQITTGLMNILHAGHWMTSICGFSCHQ